MTRGVGRPPISKDEITNKETAGIVSVVGHQGRGWFFLFRVLTAPPERSDTFTPPLRTFSFFFSQDGFPIYGQLGPGGAEMKVCDGSMAWDG